MKFPFMCSLHGVDEFSISHYDLLRDRKKSIGEAKIWLCEYVDDDMYEIGWLAIKFAQEEDATMYRLKFQ